MRAIGAVELEHERIVHDLDLAEYTAGVFGRRHGLGALEQDVGLGHLVSRERRRVLAHLHANRAVAVVAQRHREGTLVDLVREIERVRVGRAALGAGHDGVRALAGLLGELAVAPTEARLAAGLELAAVHCLAHHHHHRYHHHRYQQH